MRGPELQQKFFVDPPVGIFFWQIQYKYISNSAVKYRLHTVVVPVILAAGWTGVAPSRSDQAAG
jgi:hypothetical protein